MSTARKPRMYVNNVDFLKALLDYKETCKTNPNAPIPNYIGECWLKIGEGLSHKPNFISYTYRDEMISDGIENCLLYFNNFDPEISKNPFAYFTQIIYYAFLRRIEQENDELYLKVLMVVNHLSYMRTLPNLLRSMKLRNLKRKQKKQPKPQPNYRPV